MVFFFTISLSLSSSSSISFPIWEFVWGYFVVAVVIVAGFNLSLCGWLYRSKLPTVSFSAGMWFCQLCFCVYTCVKTFFFSIFLYVQFFLLYFFRNCKITFIASTIFPIELWIVIWCSVFFVSFFSWNFYASIYSICCLVVGFCFVSLSKLMTFSQQFGVRLWETRKFRYIPTQKRKNWFHFFRCCVEYIMYFFSSLYISTLWSPFFSSGESKWFNTKNKSWSVCLHVL